MSISIEGADVDRFIPSPISTDYHVGQMVSLTRDRVGVVRYVGQVHFSDGLFYGIELADSSIGKNNGTVFGVTYFQGRPNKCIFVNRDSILGLSDGPKPQHRRSSVSARQLSSSRPSRKSARPRGYSTPALPMLSTIKSNISSSIKQPSSSARASGAPTTVSPTRLQKKRKSVLVSSTRVNPSSRKSVGSRKRSQSAASPTTLARRTVSASKLTPARGSWRDTEMLKDKPMHPLSRHNDSRLNEKCEVPRRSSTSRSKWKGYVQGNVSGIKYEFESDRLRPWKSAASIERPTFRCADDDDDDNVFTAPAHWASSPAVVETDVNEIDVADADEEEIDELSLQRETFSSDVNELEKWMKRKKIWLSELYDCLMALEVSDPQFLDLLSPDEMDEVIDDAKRKVSETNPSGLGNAERILSQFRQIHTDIST